MPLRTWWRPRPSYLYFFSKPKPLGGGLDEQGRAVVALHFGGDDYLLPLPTTHLKTCTYCLDTTYLAMKIEEYTCRCTWIH